MKSLYHRNGRPLDTDPKAGRVRPARMRHILHGGLALLLTAALAFVPCALAEPGDLPEEPVGSESFPPAEDGYVTVASNSRLELRVNEKETWFQVVDKNGHVWSSTPEKYEEDDIAQPVARLGMASLIQISYSDSLGNISPLNGKTASVDKGGASVTRIDGGFRVEFQFEREGFFIPVEVHLREDGVEIALMSGEIRETNEKYRLTRVAIAPYFGAADAQAEGYLLLPDGSGSLIGLNQNNGYVEDYAQYVYGRDAATTRLEAGEVTRDIRMPVFGLKDGDHAFLGIITKGESRAVINAAVNGKRCSYSNVYAEFIYRDYDMVLVERKQQTVRIFEQTPTKAETMAVRYTLLEGEDADYVGMADAYRDYLFEQGLKTTAKAGEAPLVVELLGGVMAKEYILGFPVNRVVPLTSYEDAVTILTQLGEKGADQLLVDYQYWNKDGTGSAIQTDLKPEGRLGGAKKLKSLETYCEEKGIGLYLGVNVNNLYKSRWGFNKKLDAASSIQKNPAMQYTYDLTTLEANVSEPSFLLTPEKVLEACQKLAKSKMTGFTGLSAHTLGNTLYSDFGDNGLSRDFAQDVWKESLEALTQKGPLLVAEANAFVLPYVSFVTDTPMTSSSFLNETTSVPFYQIVLHGVLPQSGESANDQSDSRNAFLFALETGSSPKVRFLAQNYDILKETDYKDITSARYQDWIDSVTSSYKEIAPVLRRVADQVIVGHEILMEGVNRTTFADGTVVTVNYLETPVTVDGREIGEKGYLITEKGEDTNG